MNKLQKVDCDLHNVHKYVKTDLVSVFRKHRDKNKNTEEFSKLFMEVTAICEKLDIDVKIKRLLKGKSTDQIQTYKLLPLWIISELTFSFRTWTPC